MSQKNSESFSAPQAEGLNYSETKSHSTSDSRGVRPIRKRGYHRALKRGESWAIWQNSMDVMVASMKDMYLDSLKYGLGLSCWLPEKEPGYKPFQGIGTLPIQYPTYHTGIWVDEISSEAKICECGKDKHGFVSHSTWCPKHE